MKQRENAYTLDDLILKAKTYIKEENELDLIKKAYDFSSKAHQGQLRLTGDAYILHPLNVAMILTEVYADSETLATALLHDVINFTSVSLDDINDVFGSDIKDLVEINIKKDLVLNIVKQSKELNPIVKEMTFDLFKVIGKTNFDYPLF